MNRCIINSSFVPFVVNNISIVSGRSTMLVAAKDAITSPTTNGDAPSWVT